MKTASNLNNMFVWWTQCNHNAVSALWVSQVLRIERCRGVSLRDISGLPGTAPISPAGVALEVCSDEVILGLTEGTQLRPTPSQCFAQVSDN